MYQKRGPVPPPCPIRSDRQTTSLPVADNWIDEDEYHNLPGLVETSLRWPAVFIELPDWCHRVCLVHRSPSHVPNVSIHHHASPAVLRATITAFLWMNYGDVQAKATSSNCSLSKWAVTAVCGPFNHYGAIPASAAMALWKPKEIIFETFTQGDTNSWINVVLTLVQRLTVEQRWNSIDTTSCACSGRLTRYRDPQ